MPCGIACVEAFKVSQQLFLRSTGIVTLVIRSAGLNAFKATLTLAQGSLVGTSGPSSLLHRKTNTMAAIIEI